MQLEHLPVPSKSRCRRRRIRLAPIGGQGELVGWIVVQRQPNGPTSSCCSVASPVAALLHPRKRPPVGQGLTDWVRRVEDEMKPDSFSPLGHYCTHY